jgi:hypothetical protein
MADISVVSTLFFPNLLVLEKSSFEHFNYSAHFQALRPKISEVGKVRSISHLPKIENDLG